MSLKARLNLCLIIAVAPFLTLAGRLSYLQVFQREKLGNMASQEVEREVLLPQARGRILDRGGEILAESVPSWSCWVDKKLLSPKSVEPLAKALGAPAEALRLKLKGKAQFLAVKKGLDMETARAVAKLQLAGVGLQQNEQRSYPNGDLTRSVLGSVGTEGYGLSGLEHLYDKDLRPSAAARSEVIRDGKGRMIFSKGETAALPPKRLVLTIDRNFQYFAETALAEAVAKTAARSGTILAQDPKTGELLVAANYPPDPLKNRALQDAFEPGSTIKAITALAAVESGLIRPDELFDCEHGDWEMAPRVTIHDHEPEDMLTLSQIVERSSNIGIAKVVERVGAESFYRYARAFGLGNRTGLNYPGEASGILKGPKQLDRVHLAQVAFGQGLSASSLQLVAAYSALANGGVLLEPRLVKGVQDEDGEWVRQFPSAEVRRVGTPAGIAAVKKMLMAVVETGTGKAAAVPGYSVAGKTGTAQKIDPVTNKYSRALYTSSFIGFLPAENPRITLLVVLDEPRKGYYGSDVAAPVFARVAKDMLARLGIQPDRPIVAETVRNSGQPR